MTAQHPWWVRALLPVVVIATLVITTPETYRLAHDLLGLPLPAYTSAALPAAVDGYAVAALRFHRDRRWALGILGVLVALSVVMHTIGLDAIHVWVRAAMAVVVVVVVVAVAWRVHELIYSREQQAARAARRHEAATRPRTNLQPVDRWPAAPWPAGPEGDATALAWLNSQPPEGRTRPALAGASGWPRTGRRVRRLVDEASAAGADVGAPAKDTERDPHQNGDGHGHARTVATSPSTVSTTAVPVGEPSGHVV